MAIVKSPLHPDYPHALTRDAYLWLRRLAADDAAPTDPQRWHQWQDIERRLASTAPVLRHDRVRADLRRAEWNPFGPLQAAARAWRRFRRG